MQVTPSAVYEMGNLYFGAANIVAALTIVLYSIRKSRLAEPETKSAFRPLIVIAMAFLSLGVGYILTSYESRFGVVLLVKEYYLLYLFLLAELILLGLSGSMVLKRRYPLIGATAVSGICAVLLAAAIVLTLQSGSDPVADMYFFAGSLIRSVTLTFVSAVFLWIAYSNRRGTSTALGFALTVQLLALPGLYTGPIATAPLNMIAYFFSLMGPAMVTFAFLVPEQDVSLELFGYGASFSGPVMIVAALEGMGYGVIFPQSIYAGFAGLAVMVSSATAAYLYGRWRQSRQTPTLALTLSFGLLSGSHMFGVLAMSGAMPTALGLHIELIGTMMAFALFSSVAINAAGHRTLGAFPFLIAVPAIVLASANYPDSTLYLITEGAFMAVPLVILFITPSIFYLLVWRNMRRTGAAGSSKPLCLAVGVLAVIMIHMTAVFASMEGLHAGYALASAPYLLMWLGLTGRLEPRVRGPARTINPQSVSSNRHEGANTAD
ncbi:MAG: hypothetical protein HXY34_03655 [Candidatus Thorarchaeota archaeon]|nr:hypothetical protein [Candidatus Thorarchaeota archaeon]